MITRGFKIGFISIVIANHLGWQKQYIRAYKVEECIELGKTHGLLENSSSEANRSHEILMLNTL